MYILSCGVLVAGHRAADADVSGWSVGLQTSIVAHSSRECSSACISAASPLRRGAARRRGGRRGQRSQRRERERAQAPQCCLREAMRLTIAPAPARSTARRGCGIPVHGVDTRSAEVVELLGRVPVFSTLERDDLERIAELAVPRTLRAGPGRVPRGRRERHLLRRARRATRARSAAHGDGRTITLATFGPGDIFGELAMFEDERRSATVEAIEPTSVVAVLGPDMRRLMSEHPEIADAAGDRARPAPARDQRAPLAPVLPDRAEPRRGRARRARRAGGRRRARRRATCSSPPRRPTSRSSRAPRASRPAASSRCSSAPG